VSINARDDLAALFSRGGNQLIADSFRYIQFERPDKVIDAINESRHRAGVHSAQEATKHSKAHRSH
jgi:hypothetical protein